MVDGDGRIDGLPEDSDLGANAFVVTARNDVLGTDGNVLVTVVPTNHAPKWTANPI